MTHEEMRTVFLSILQWLVNIPFSAMFRIEGDSMLPLVKDGEFVLIVRTRFRWNRLRRGDVALFERPQSGPLGARGISTKRVIGLPGEDITIADGKIYINGRLLKENYQRAWPNQADGEWFNGQEEYFFMGDNLCSSTDSRNHGPVDVISVKGKVWLRCWPLSRLQPFGREPADAR